MSLIFTALKEGNYVARASLVLRTLEGTDLQILDILVRESIQNSLDAFKNTRTSVSVDFSLKEMSLKPVCSIFDESTKSRLLKKFSDKDACKVLSIKDTGTTGLSGDYSDKNSKIYKLVGDIGRAQESEGAGGSWGLGKTCYYHMGTNIVGFYSRSLDGQNKIRSSLCFGYIEDERKSNRLIKKTPTGIAWWGDGEGAPIHNQRTIDSILSKFGVCPFKEDETGTCIIIPFFGQAESAHILSGPVPETWEEEESEYLKVAIQRWYSNRLMKTEKRSRLVAKVNGEELDDLLPAFSLLTQLKGIVDNFKRHTSTATTGGLMLKKDKDDPLGWSIDERENARPKAYIKSINIQNLRDSVTGGRAPAGWITAMHLNEKDLRMLAPHNEPSPHKHIFGSYEEPDEMLPIVAMSRGPQMIVAYNTDEWRRGLKMDSQGEYLLALFVLNSDAELGCGTSLEEYIRSIENPTHTDWKDSKPSSVHKRIPINIRNGVVSALRNVFFNENTILDNESSASYIRTLLGKNLLPPDFGNEGTSPPPTPPASDKRPSSPPRTAKPTIDIYNTEYDRNGMTLFLTITNGQSAILELSLEADAGSGQTVNNKAWEAEIGPPGFPFKITEFLATGIREIAKKGKPKDFRQPKPGEVKIKDDSLNPRVTFRNFDPVQITVELSLTTSDKSINPVLKLVPLN